MYQQILMYINLSISMLICLTACANIEFELSPYAPRDVIFVDSEQEDLHFIFWRLGPTIDPEKVEFELYRNGKWGKINLNSAPFPASPYACEKKKVKATCYQFQSQQRLNYLENGMVPLRAVHVDEGIYFAKFF